jgi:hypothetical protein
MGSLHGIHLFVWLYVDAVWARMKRPGFFRHSDQCTEPAPLEIMAFTPYLKKSAGRLPGFLKNLSAQVSAGGSSLGN